MQKHLSSPWLLAALLLSFTLGYYYLDLTIALWAQQLNAPLTKDIFGYITEIGHAQNPLLLLAVATLYFHLYRRNSALTRQCLFIIACIAVAGISCDIVKVLLSRARPTLYFQQSVYGWQFCKINPDAWSFPSGHCVTAMAMLSGLSLLRPQFWLLSCIIGGLVACSRVILGAHYPSDVIVGLYWGMACAVLTHTYWLSKSWIPSSSTRISANEVT